MAAGGVYVKVKCPDWILKRYPDKDPYIVEDISNQIIEFLRSNYDYSFEDASDLVEWGWQNDDEYKFLEKVKQEYLTSGLFDKAYILE